MWLPLGLVGLLALVYLFSLFRDNKIAQLVRIIRWSIGGVICLLGAFMCLRGQFGIGSIIVAFGVGVILKGRLGPIDLGAGRVSPGQKSTVESDYFEMELNHDTGAVSGAVRKGYFKGRALIDLDATECWALYDEVQEDTESRALFETWLDKNRSGWEEYWRQEYGFVPEYESKTHVEPELNDVDEAFAILGLSRGASAAEIKAVHRTLIKTMHPDTGGTEYLAAKINRAKDIALESTSAKD